MIKEVRVLFQDETGDIGVRVDPPMSPYEAMGLLEAGLIMIKQDWLLSRGDKDAATGSEQDSNNNPDN